MSILLLATNLLLTSHTQLSKEHVSDPHATSTPIQTPISSGVKLPSSLAINYVTLGSFSWDQDNDKVKVTDSFPEQNLTRRM